MNARRGNERGHRKCFYAGIRHKCSFYKFIGYLHRTSFWFSASWRRGLDDSTVISQFNDYGEPVSDDFEKRVKQHTRPIRELKNSLKTTTTWLHINDFRDRNVLFFLVNQRLPLLLLLPNLIYSLIISSELYFDNFEKRVQTNQRDLYRRRFFFLKTNVIHANGQCSFLRPSQNKITKIRISQHALRTEYNSSVR